MKESEHHSKKRSYPSMELLCVLNVDGSHAAPNEFLVTFQSPRIAAAQCITCTLTSALRAKHPAKHNHNVF